MQILNVGIWEIFFVLLIMLVVLGPENMMKTARQLGRYWSRMTKSPVWATLISTSRDIREIPTRIVREAGLEEARQELERSTTALSSEIERELSPAKEQVELANQAIETTASSIAHQSVPFVMRKESDDKPKEAEEVSNPPETDETEEMVEDALEDAIPDSDERSIVPPAIIESDPESFEKAIIEPIVNISHPDPLQDELIKGRPMTIIPKREPGAKLPEDVPPPPVEIPDQPPDEAAGDEDTQEQDD